MQLYFLYGYIYVFKPDKNKILINTFKLINNYLPTYLPNKKVNKY